MKKPNTIIITGASGVIGQATAQLLSSQGYDLLLVDQKEESLRKFTTNLKNCTTASIDVTDSKAMENLFDIAANDLAGVVLAAGIEGSVAAIEDYSDSVFQEVMTTNVVSVWLGIKQALRIFKPKKRGNIIALSSISGLAAMPMLSAYCASKHAVIGLVKTAAREAASSGIRVNAVCPGPVASKMMERIDSAMSELYPDRLNGHTNASRVIPMQRYATPEEVANLIGFLCSDASSYCTGATMTVDGGLTCK